MSLVDVTRLGRFLDKVKELINNHTHSNYFPVNGGTINGNTNVAGVLRVQGQQAFYYSSDSSSQTIGTNNATGGTTICCGASANVIVNGTNTKTSNIIPKANNAYTLGNTAYRWKGIYSTSALNVSSDERCKRDIEKLNIEKLSEFIDGLEVVSYNYNEDSIDSDKRIGLIAQQMQTVDPEVAKFFVTEDQNGMLGLKPSDLVFPLIATVQQLKAEVEELKKSH